MSEAGHSAIVVVQPGLSTTVQDAGRHGWQRFGVPVSGALDRVALAAANTVVGNSPGEAGLECLYQGCQIEIAGVSARIAVAGAGASIEVHSGDVGGDVGGSEGGGVRIVLPLESIVLRRGQRARVKMAGPSISAYLAVEGGFAITPALGSKSTFVRAALGGFHGRALRQGDALPLSAGVAVQREERRLAGVELAPQTVIRIVPGPQDDHFAEGALAQFAAQSYAVRPASDRMGLRLMGPKLAHKRGADIVSDGIAPGAIQVPGDGLPIIMLADRQTTGGYTKIATVASADLPALGRVGPGAVLRFEVVDVEAAEAVAQALAAEIGSWLARLQAAGNGDWRARLYEANLISGVTDG